MITPVQYAPDPPQASPGLLSELPPLPEPRTIEATGLPPHVLVELAAKTMYYRARANEGELTDLLQLSRPVIDELMDRMKREGLIETLAQAGPLQFEYALTDRGRHQALEAFERGRYVGAAPVPYQQYLEMQQAQAVRTLAVTADGVSSALSHLVQPDELVRSVGAGVVSAATLMLYGHSGNGKSTIAASIRNMLPGAVAIPHAIDVGGHTIRIFDPRSHEEIPFTAAPTMDGDGESFSRNTYDRRYALCRRPLVTLGSELSLGDLELGFSTVDLTYTAPPQVKANGGVLVVDDLGRQRVRPEELLNRWMSPMATGIDQLTLRTGELLRVPFDVILVFATNLLPEEIGDEAFLRRIRHKVEVLDPTHTEYVEIFRRTAEEIGLAFDERVVDHVLSEFYERGRRPLRASHPGDLLQNVIDFARFEGEPPAFTVAALDRACRAYFV
jgi:predicted ATPase with chaperone activity